MSGFRDCKAEREYEKFIFVRCIVGLDKWYGSGKLPKRRKKESDLLDRIECKTILGDIPSISSNLPYKARSQSSLTVSRMSSGTSPIMIS